MANTNASSIELNPLFNNQSLSDVTLRQTCDGVSKVYHVQKAVLASQSKWFYSAFYGNFKEATSKAVELNDDNPDHFELLLKCIYSRNYEPSSSTEIIGTYIVADKYGCDDIKDALIVKFDKTEQPMSDLEFGAIAELFYENCAGTANTTLGAIIAGRIAKGIDKMSLPACLKVKELCKRFPDFGRDLAVHLVEAHERRLAFTGPSRRHR